MADRGGVVFYREEDKVESMYNVIALSDGGMGEVVMHKLNGVRKKEFFCDGIGYLEAAVVV